MTYLSRRGVLICIIAAFIVSCFAGCEGPAAKKPVTGRINVDSKMRVLMQKEKQYAAKMKDTNRKMMELVENVKRKEGHNQNLTMLAHELDMIIEDLAKYGGARRRDTITLDDQFFFKTGSADLTEQGEKYLLKIARELAKIEYLIRVEGHTDPTPVVKSRPKYIDNWGLSAARAGSVIRFLQSKGGIPGDRLIGAFFGPFKPIAANTKEGNILNRRVEIRLIPPFLEKDVKRVGLTEKTLKKEPVGRPFRRPSSYLEGIQPEPEVRKPVRIEEKPVKPEPEGFKPAPPITEEPPVKEEEPDEEEPDEDDAPVIIK